MKRMCLGLLLWGQLHGVDLGVQGRSYSIVERSPIHDTYAKPNPHLDERLLQAMQQLSVVRMQSPKQGTLLPCAHEYRRQEIPDQMAGVVPLLLIDGEDEAQISWAEGQEESLLWVLVAGSVEVLAQREGHPIYFDQAGMIARRLGIQSVPALIRTQGEMLIIEEVPLCGNG